MCNDFMVFMNVFRYFVMLTLYCLDNRIHMWVDDEGVSFPPPLLLFAGEGG